MDYSKLLKQDLIELLEQRSFADFIYKEEAEMRKLLLKQNAEKDNHIKYLHTDLNHQILLKEECYDQKLSLMNSIELIKTQHNNELEQLKIQLTSYKSLINRFDELLEVFLDLCENQESKDLLKKIFDMKIDSKKSESVVDEFDNLDLDFDELDREVSASQELDLDDDDLDLDFDEFEDDLDDSLSAELDDDLDDDLELDDDLDDLDLDFDELDDKTDIKNYADNFVEKIFNEGIDDFIAKNPDKKSFIESVMNRKK